MNDNNTFSVEIPLEEIKNRASSNGISWSGWYGGSSSNAYNCRIGISWSSNGNTSNNTSTVTATAYFYSSAVETYGVAKSGVLTINGSSKSFSKAVSYGDWGSTNSVTLASHSVSGISHNSDGNKTITISVSWDLNITYAGTWIGTMSHSVSATLDKLLSPPSAPTWCTASGRYEVGEKVNVSWGGASGTITKYNVAYRQWDTVSGWTNWSSAGSTSGTSLQHQIISVGDTRQCLQYRVEATNSAGASSWSPGSGYVYHYGVRVNQGGFKWATVKVWTGSTWEHAIVKVWNGSSWSTAR